MTKKNTRIELPSGKWWMIVADRFQPCVARNEREQLLLRLLAADRRAPVPVGESPPNDQLRETFVRWYPGMQTEQQTEIEEKAA